MRLAIGDIHGRNYWKQYLKENFSEFYILGDYFDSPVIPFSKQYRNFIEIVKTTRRDSRIKLCLGNHDYHYLEKINNERYSGFQGADWFVIQEILEENIELLKIVYVTADNYIISHAGLSAPFMDKMKILGVKAIEEINDAFTKDRTILNFDGNDIHGDDITQSPIWIRPDSLCTAPIAGYNQIVGHTPKYELKEVFVPDPENMNGTIKITFIDTGSIDLIYRF
ncbi:hypothetical protein FACS189468_3800 [Spirochaetia bacterium]|nr:hypothetical protein FACS189468_3800 [Spirochaetia bacterium]